MDRILWVFFKKDKPQTRVNLVGTDSAKNLARLLNIQEWSEWMVQKEGEKVSQPLIRRQEFKKDCQPRNWDFASEEVEELQELKEGAWNNSKIIEDPDIEYDPSGKQRFPRYLYRYQVVIVAGYRAFRTYTKDISLGGIQINRPLPRNVHGKSCQIFIKHPHNKETLKVEAEFMGDINDTSRLRFKEENSEEFRRRLQSWINHQKKQNQSAA